MSPTILLREKFSEIKVKSWEYKGILKGGREFSLLDFLSTTPEVLAKPFVKWVGGKRQLVKQLRGIYLPPERAVFLIYNHIKEEFLTV